MAWDGLITYRTPVNILSLMGTEYRVTSTVKMVPAGFVSAPPLRDGTMSHILHGAWCTVTIFHGTKVLHTDPAWILPYCLHGTPDTIWVVSGGTE